MTLGVDNTEAALKTFVHNHEDSSAMCLDLHTDESIDAIVEASKDHDIDSLSSTLPNH